MKVYQRYIVLKYIKSFIIIFFALEFFYIGIDLLSNYQKLPKSASLEILYVLLQSANAINYTLPLSVVFAMIVFVLSMVKSNELVSFYSLGLSKQSVSKLLFVTSLSITIVYILLNFTQFSYVDTYRYNLLKYKQILTNTNYVFLANGDDYIFFKKINPIKKNATDIKIFKIKNGDLTSVIEAKKGDYRVKQWILYDGKETIKPKVNTINSNGIVVKDFITKKALTKFRPKIIDNIYKGEVNFSILDAIEALKFYNKQSLDTDKIKAIILSKIFIPLFAPFLVIIFFTQIPIISRYSNSVWISSILSFSTIFIWGILFLLSKLAINSVITPEIAIMIPIFLLASTAFYFYTKK
ncbi:LptF/LptG family permease [Sulfurospirillum sp. 1307]|jgi:lipopolysaccharide export system permease protein